MSEDGAESSAGTEREKKIQRDECEIDGCTNETEHSTERIRAVCCNQCVEYHDEHGEWPDKTGPDTDRGGSGE